MQQASPPAAPPEHRQVGEPEILPLLPHERPLAPGVDLAIAAAFFAMAVAIIGMSLSFPTYLNQGGTLYQAPGFVPSFYGMVMAVLSVWLGARAINRRATWLPDETSPAEGDSPGRLVLAAALGLFFTLGLLGRVPFWLATAIFVASFVIAFEIRLGEPLRQRLRTVAIAVLLGLATGAAITLVFSRIFLVRLP